MEQEYLTSSDVEKTEDQKKPEEPLYRKGSKWKRRRNLLLLLPEYFDLGAAVRFTELLNVSGGTILNDVKWLHKEGYLVKPQRGYYKKVRAFNLRSTAS